MAMKLYQSWALAFQAKKDLSFFVDRYNEMKNSGEHIPGLFWLSADCKVSTSRHHLRPHLHTSSIPPLPRHGSIRMSA